MCCKTHRFGGHVTLSRKNTVGLGGQARARPHPRFHA
jgi:hypothetical protein